MIKLIASIILSLFVISANAQTKIKSGFKIDAEILKNEQDVYTIEAKKGQYLDMLIQQSGVDVQITLFNSKNDTLKYFDSPTGESGVEEIEYVFKQAGKFKLIVEPLPAAVNGYTDPEVIKKYEEENQGKYSIEKVILLTAKEYALKLEKEGQRLQKVVSWFNEKAVPLKTSEPESGFEDLQFLKPILKDVKVVGVGEATHGTQDFFKMKHRFLEFLVTEMDFRVFAIEASYAACLDINNYVLNGVGTKEEVLAGQGFWTWDTQEVLDMIEWIKDYNTTVNNEGKVSFWGVDMQSLKHPFERMKPFLSKVDNYLIPRMDKMIEEFTEVGKSFYKNDLSREKLISSVDSLTSVKEAYFKLIKSNKNEYIEKTSVAAYDSIVDLKRVFNQAWHSTTSRINKGDQTEIPLEIRDKYMGENTIDLLNNKEKNKKMVLWAHNGHLSADPESYVNGGLKPMGAYIREAIGAAYYSIAFLFSEGSFQAVDMNPGERKLRSFTVEPAKKPSAEWMLAQSNYDISFTNLRQPKTSEVDNYLKNEFSFMSIGAGYSDAMQRTGYVHKNFTKQHDAVIFWRKTKRAVPTEAIKKRMKVE